MSGGSSAEARTRAGAGAGAGAGVTVLLVEDDAGDALLVQEHLDDHRGEFHLVWARDLNEALSLLARDTDCVLLDLDLPDANGLDALQAILDARWSPAVVVLTGFDDRFTGEKALALGSQDYLTKGAVDSETLARSLRYAIARRRGEESSRQLREAEMARAENARLQRGLLPHPLVLRDQLSLAVHYQAGGQRALLGGDFFDAVERPDGTVRVVIGDVSGHGPDEAALGVALRVAWRTLAMTDLAPEHALGALERLLEVERLTDEVFATICDVELASELDRARIRLAGHPQPLLFRRTTVGEVPVSWRGPMLGGLGPAEWRPNPIDLGTDWTLLLFTDGIVEGRAGGGPDRLDVSGLRELATRALRSARNLDEVADALVGGAEAANGGPLLDDVALVLLSTDGRWRW